MKKIFVFAVVILFLLCFNEQEAYAQGCSMCKLNAKDAQETNNGMAAGLNAGILYLMAIPYILLFLLFRKKIVSFFKELRSMQ